MYFQLWNHNSESGYMSCFVKIASFHGILPPFRYVQDSGRSNKITSPWQDLMEPWKWPAVENFGQNDPNITWWDLDGGHPGSAGISEDVIFLAERSGTLSDILKILTTSCVRNQDNQIIEIYMKTLPSKWIVTRYSKCNSRLLWDTKASLPQVDLKSVS